MNAEQLTTLAEKAKQLHTKELINLLTEASEKAAKKGSYSASVYYDKPFNVETVVQHFSNLGCTFGENAYWGISSYSVTW